MFPLPVYVGAIILASLLGVAGTFCVALWRGALIAGLKRNAAAQITAVAGIGWAAWTIVSVVLANADVYRMEPATAKPWIVVGVIVPLAAVLLFTRIGAVSRSLDHPDALRQLTLPQNFRLVGVAFIATMALGKVARRVRVAGRPRRYRDRAGDTVRGAAHPSRHRRTRRGVVHHPGPR